jgi:hypothetical protein
MKRALLVLVFAMFAGGCHLFAHASQSTFLSRFSLERSAKQTDYKGIDSSRGPGGESGMGGGISRIGQPGTSYHQSTTTGFAIHQEGDNKFNEGEFIRALTTQIRKEIEENRGSITGSGSPTSNEFYVDYKDGNIKGRISISGSASGQSYVLKANIDESNKP